MDFEIDQAALTHVRDTLWDNFWAQGGFGMYPTAFWGVLLLYAAGLYVLRPQERFLRMVAILASMTLASGMFGTADHDPATAHGDTCSRSSTRLASTSAASAGSC